MDREFLIFVTGFALSTMRSLTGRVHAGHRESAGALLTANLVDEVLVRAHALHGSHSVSGVGMQIFFDAFPGIKLSILRQIDRITDVPVEIDDPRHDKLSREIHDFGARGSLEHRRPADPGNTAVVDNHGRFRHGRPAGSVDQGEVFEYFYFGIERARQKERANNCKTRSFSSEHLR